MGNQFKLIKNMEIEYTLKKCLQKTLRFMLKCYNYVNQELTLVIV